MHGVRKSDISKFPMIIFVRTRFSLKCAW